MALMMGSNSPLSLVGILWNDHIKIRKTCQKMTHSELLTKLMDDVVHRPSEIRTRDVANLSVEELAIYMKFLAKQKRETGSEFEKYVKKEPPTDPFKDIAEEEK